MSRGACVLHEVVRHDGSLIEAWSFAVARADGACEEKRESFRNLAATRPVRVCFSAGEARTASMVADNGGEDAEFATFVEPAGAEIRRCFQTLNRDVEPRCNRWALRLPWPLSGNAA